MRRERALTVIIAYKVGKGVLWLILAPILAVAVHVGLGRELAALADQLRHNTHAWSLELAKLITRAATPRGLWTVVIALVADGVASLFEGWALVHGRWWGPWLVVVSTSTLLPFEVVALARHPHVGRAVLLVVNAAIVVYLARKALLERGSHGGGAPAGEGQGR